MIEGDWRVLIYFDQRGSIKPSRRHPRKMDGANTEKREWTAERAGAGGRNYKIDSYDQLSLSRRTMTYDS